MSASHSGFSSGGESVSVRTSYQHGASAQANGLDDVRAATHASIHQYFNLISYGFHHFGQNLQSGWSAIKLPSTMVGDDDGRRSVIHSAAGILGLSTPLTTIGPGQSSRIQRKSFQVTEVRSRASLMRSRGIGPWPGTTIFGRVGMPPSSRKLANHRGCASSCGKKGTFARTLLSASSLSPLRIPFAHACYRGVDCDHQGGETGCPGALDHTLGTGASADQVELIPSGPEDAAFTSSSRWPEALARINSYAPRRRRGLRQFLLHDA